jgi:CRISPR-associated protein Cas1
MKHLLNTLYVMTEDAYLSKEGDNVVIQSNSSELGRFPLHTLESIVSFSYSGASPALMGFCAHHGINMCFMSRKGRFLARTVGENNGNVLLRKRQFQASENEIESCMVARNMILGKVYNSRWSIERTTRDHPLRVNVECLKAASDQLQKRLQLVGMAESLANLRGLEGEAAAVYFGVFDEMILNNKESFFYRTRSRRPPLDNVNALLSFTYSLLTNDCASALEGVGLDSYVGFLHRDKPGRPSLALDLMEELRPIAADRFVLTVINMKVVTPDDFIDNKSGGIIMTDSGKKKLLSAWQEKKKDVITHPYLKEKMAWGLVPHIQALLLDRYLRGDMETYAPFLWK